MPNFTGTTSWNFFSMSFTNRIAKFDSGSIEDLTIRKKLSEATKWPFITGLADTASIKNDGTAVSVPNVPY